MLNSGPALTPSYNDFYFDKLENIFSTADPYLKKNKSVLVSVAFILEARLLSVEQE